MAHSYRILVASYSNDIYSLSFDPSTRSLTRTSSIEAGFHPSWITHYPGDSSLVFASVEQENGKIIVLKYDNNARGIIVAEASSGGDDPCSLLATKDQLLIANYSSGHVSFLPIAPEPPYILKETPTTITLTGSGPNKDRQLSSHPHQVYLNEEHEEVLVPDLGGDRVYRFKRDPAGTWTPQSHIAYQPGGGPRHVAFYNGTLYTLLELTSTVVSHRLPPQPAEPSFVRTVETMSQPPSFPSDMLAAEILIPHPNATFPTPYIYVSNRNDPSPGGDIISIFSTEAKFIAEVRSGLKHLRGMAFGGPDDKWLVAGGALGGGIKIFERVNDGKGLVEIAANNEAESPTGFLWL
ncbi:Lactonase, 7-bladed beta-propeller-domain-containing protein [Desarmillaria tabescens]|uniref:Lactonase, 7-bladed beta-propeller-domain-containing protein n=1 Tax=Armillaria tabescens TaxID=1929756 RepID=A0AA39MV50_ARMTA|nr:Lactonase, 7-bladed beta-propeller-domain-containing protein [Desarmillaria tabescens]KAK0446975.1 Lactonase, 7-bladed beta-propeller-domain-containing protein [Desarmillaria tabescens]